MGQTDPQFNLIAEVAIYLLTKPEFERANEGDIITSRRPQGGIGRKTAGNQYLWLLIDGLEENQLFALFQPLVEGDPDGDLPTSQVEKHRFNIALEDLVLRDSNFDIVAARDPDIIYQPYLVLDEQDFVFAEGGILPFDAQGLVFDKETGFYL